jgi:predicted RNA-binding protein associated with RNAse of E/G family
MENPILYRKRFIPDECIELKDDIILERNDSIIVTKWSTIHKRCDISHGYSCYYLDRGYKISKFLKEDGSLFCWYCDIITYDFDEKSNKLLVIDLLADVKIYPDGLIKVVDLDELSEAFEKRLIDETLLKKSLLTLNRLLNEVYENGIEPLAQPIEQLVENVSTNTNT